MSDLEKKFPLIKYIPHVLTVIMALLQIIWALQVKNGNERYYNLKVKLEDVKTESGGNNDQINKNTIAILEKDKDIERNKDKIDTINQRNFDFMKNIILLQTELNHDSKNK